MLRINHTVHLPVPHLRHSGQKLALSPVRSENDELIQAIDMDAHADEWQLSDTDGQSLTDFWNGVEEDIAKDPEWFTFAED